MNKIKSNYYEKYVGSYAKRFYTSFTKDTIFKIIDFRIRLCIAEIQVTDGTDKWWWDVEDCVFISNEKPIFYDERVANIANVNYNGWNPFDETMLDNITKYSKITRIRSEIEELEKILFSSNFTIVPDGYLKTKMILTTQEQSWFDKIESLKAELETLK